HSNDCQRLLIPFSRQYLCKTICQHLPCFTVLKSNLSPRYPIVDTMIFDSNKLVTSLVETMSDVGDTGLVITVQSCCKQLRNYCKIC
ncbi:hypothetical protein L873DRAFT_1914701, partial [Choiromyces venosus 120613-1]